MQEAGKAKAHLVCDDDGDDDDDGDCDDDGDDDDDDDQDDNLDLNSLMSPCMASTGYNQGDLLLEYIQDTFQPKYYAFVPKKNLEEFKKIVTDLKKLATAYFGLLLLC